MAAIVAVVCLIAFDDVAAQRGLATPPPLPYPITPPIFTPVVPFRVPPMGRATPAPVPFGPSALREFEDQLYRQMLGSTARIRPSGLVPLQSATQGYSVEVSALIPSTLTTTTAQAEMARRSPPSAAREDTSPKVSEAQSLSSALAASPPPPIAKSESSPTTIENAAGIRRQARVRFSSLPSPATLNVPFSFTAELLEDVGDDVVLQFDRAEGIKYATERLVLRGGAPQEVQATVTTAPAGLAEIVATLAGTPVRSTLDVQFGGNLKLDARGLEVGKQAVAQLQFVNNKGGQLQLGAPVTVQVSGRGLMFQSGGQWVPTLNIPVSKGASMAAPFFIKPDDWGTDAAVISAAVMLGPAHTISDASFPLTVSSSQVTRAIAYVLGSLLCVAYLTLRSRRFHPKPILVRSAMAVIVGLAAFSAAELNLLGISTETIPLRGLALVGFLFTYFGLDTVLNLKFPQLAEAKAGKKTETPKEKKKHTKEQG